MGSEWRKTTLGEVLTLQRGFDLPETDRRAGRFPVIASTGQVGTHYKPMVRGPGVVIGRSGSLGGGQFIKGDFWPLNTTLWVKDFKGNNPRFCYYLLKSLDFSHFNVGSGVPTLNRNHIHPLPVVVPSDQNEQRAIAHILGTLDDKIELNRRMNQTLEEMARALFKSWFVDFDPVRAKATVRREHPDWSNAQVSRAACPTLKPEIAELFPDEFENSELGEIPKGWRVSRLGDIADVNWGDTNVTKSSYVNEGYLAYSAKGPDGFLSYYDYDCVGVVVSAIGANSGFTWLARGKWSCIKNTIRFWSIVSDISTEYLYFATHGNNIWPLRGSAQPFISQTDAQNLRVLHPSNGLARKFGDTISPLFDRIDFSIHESRTLAALRDTLLPKLISGVLRVKDAERFLKRMGESFIGVS